MGMDPLLKIIIIPYHSTLLDTLIWCGKWSWRSDLHESYVLGLGLFIYRVVLTYINNFHTIGLMTQYEHVALHFKMNMFWLQSQAVLN